MEQALRLIEEKMNYLRKVRRIVVKGEMRFIGDDRKEKCQNVVDELKNFNIKCNVVEFSGAIYLKIEGAELDTIENETIEENE